MHADERAIRDLVAEWLSATAAGDPSRLCGLMDEDVVFLTPDQPPLRGRDRFVAGLKAVLAQIHIDATPDVQEVQVAGDLAYCSNPNAPQNAGPGLRIDRHSGARPARAGPPGLLPGPRLAGDGADARLQLVNQERQEKVIRPWPRPVRQSPEA
jgi:hypothetical protein